MGRPTLLDYYLMPTTINPPICPLGAYLFFGSLHWGLFEGGAYKFSLVVSHTPVETFLLVKYFIDATHTSNKIFSKGQAKFH